MVSHKTLDVALHSHSASAVMLTVTVPPAAPTDVLVGCTPKVQPCDWLTDKVCPATTAVPIRDLPDVAPTVTETRPARSPMQATASATTRCSRQSTDRLRWWQSQLARSSRTGRRRARSD